LLNYILPDIFDDLEAFNSWFDFSHLDEKEEKGEGDGKEDASNEARKSALSSKQTGYIISQLHAILKPFLLRRTKKEICQARKSESLFKRSTSAEVFQTKFTIDHQIPTLRSSDSETKRTLRRSHE
jgi:ATP-dependent DNA helicase